MQCAKIEANVGYRSLLVATALAMAACGGVRFDPVAKNDANAPGDGALDAAVDAAFTGRGTTYIKASNPDSGDQFGYAVAISADGNTLAVGAFFERSAATGIDVNQADNSAPNAGAVYIFARAGDAFGNSVALAAIGDTLAVGADLEDSGAAGDQLDNTATDSGAAYVFARAGTTWNYVKASTIGAFDYFGHDISLAADST